MQYHYYGKQAKNAMYTKYTIYCYYYWPAAGAAAAAASYRSFSQSYLIVSFLPNCLADFMAIYFFLSSARLAG